MRKIYLLTDYKNRFGLKEADTPYRSGFDKGLLGQIFFENGFEAIFRHLSAIDFRSKEYENELVLYTSQEDVNYLYKSYIEDVVFGLEKANSIVIPAYKYLRANNNKVFMEILRDQISLPGMKNLKAFHFGAYEDFLKHSDEFTNPNYVIKTAKGASGSGVFLSKSPEQLKDLIKKVSRSKNLFAELWEIGRVMRHKGYLKESKHRKKYVLQEFIPNLKNDWKIYIFGNRYYIFYRPVFKHREFKASGGGYDNYFYGLAANPPEGIFDFAEQIKNELNIPHASLDISYDGKEFYLMEFQCLYFGTAGVLRSNEYFTRSDGKWVAIENKLSQEKVYIDGLLDYLEKNKI
jgi:glutathione synthase/RimK-type ligase-like ATP-grasp enzyme